MDKEYRISSIADFLQVPEEKQPELLADFATWLRTAKRGKEIADKLAEMTGTPGQIHFNMQSFTWVDDGIRGTSGLDIVDAQDKKRIARVPLSPLFHQGDSMTARDSFEAFMRSRAFIASDFRQDQLGQYKEYYVQAYWEVWQAALATVPPLATEQEDKVNGN